MTPLPELPAPVHLHPTSLTHARGLAWGPPLPSTEHLRRSVTAPDGATVSLISHTRSRLRSLLHGRDDRLLVVIGPCSIHDPQAALEYAGRLARERDRLGGALEILMRVYFEKPRTTVGWKGLIHDPDLDGIGRLDEGLRIARQLLVDIHGRGVPAATEFLDPIAAPYLEDLISWGAIGARTTESQTHREMASGLPMPVGFKNGTDGNINIACDAIEAAAAEHQRFGVHPSGAIAVQRTPGNADAHLILRGGREPNYQAAFVSQASATLRARGLTPRLMIDCSHGNSQKRHELQRNVAADIAARIEAGDEQVFGVMVESHLKAGRQAFTVGTDRREALVYGQSITDACLDWEASVPLLQALHDAVLARRHRSLRGRAA